MDQDSILDEDADDFSGFLDPDIPLDPMEVSEEAFPELLTVGPSPTEPDHGLLGEEATAEPTSLHVAADSSLSKPDVAKPSGSPVKVPATSGLYPESGARSDGSKDDIGMEMTVDDKEEPVKKENAKSEGIDCSSCEIPATRETAGSPEATTTTSVGATGITEVIAMDQDESIPQPTLDILTTGEGKITKIKSFPASGESAPDPQRSCEDIAELHIDNISPTSFSLSPLKKGSIECSAEASRVTAMTEDGNAGAEPSGNLAETPDCFKVKSQESAPKKDTLCGVVDGSVMDTGATPVAGMTATDETAGAATDTGETVVGLTVTDDTTSRLADNASRIGNPVDSGNTIRESLLSTSPDNQVRKDMAPSEGTTEVVVVDTASVSECQIVTPHNTSSTATCAPPAATVDTGPKMVVGVSDNGDDTKGAETTVRVQTDDTCMPLDGNNDVAMENVCSSVKDIPASADIASVSVPASCVEGVAGLDRSCSPTAASRKETDGLDEDVTVKRFEIVTTQDGDSEVSPKTETDTATAGDVAEDETKEIAAKADDVMEVMMEDVTENVTEDVTKAISAKTQYVTEAISLKAEDVTEATSAKAKYVTEAFSAKAEEVTEEISTTADNMTDAISAKAEDVTEAIAAKREDVTEAISIKVEDVAEAIVAKAEDVAEAIVAKGEDLAEAIVGKGEDVAEAIVAKGEDVTAAIVTKREDVTEALVAKGEDVTEAKSVKAEDVTVSPAAEGGSVSTSSVALGIRARAEGGSTKTSPVIDKIPAAEAGSTRAFPLTDGPSTECESATASCVTSLTVSEIVTATTDSGSIRAFPVTAGITSVGGSAAEPCLTQGIPARADNASSAMSPLMEPMDHDGAPADTVGDISMDVDSESTQTYVFAGACSAPDQKPSEDIHSLVSADSAQEHSVQSSVEAGGAGVSGSTSASRSLSPDSQVSAGEPRHDEDVFVTDAKDVDGDEGESNANVNEDQTVVEYDEPEFNWDEYLEETNSLQAPPTGFKHVEISLRSNFEKGMKLEVLHQEEDGTGGYWLATIVMSCGQLLRLRHDGHGDDGAADFWRDAFGSDIHPLGWCQEQGKPMEPPSGVKEKLPDWKSYLQTTIKDSRTASAKLLEGRLGTAPIDQIKEGMRLEVQGDLNPQHLWLVRVMENVGGRLLLRYEGTDSAEHDFWLFYSDRRLHAIGWAQDMELDYQPPHTITDVVGDEATWRELLKKAKSEAEDMMFPEDIFQDQEIPQGHGFDVGWKVEAVHQSHIVPATVTKVIDDMYFLVEIDDLEPDDRDKVTICCHGGTSTILPVNWSSQRNLKVNPPNGMTTFDFDWKEYLTTTRSQAAPEDAFCLEKTEHEVEKGMKLEVVSPTQPGQVCAATVVRVVDHLLWIHIDSNIKGCVNLIEPADSHKLFPVGWCESNNYPLKPPKKSLLRKAKAPAQEPVSSSVVPLGKELSSPAKQALAGGRGSSWCPKIYFNHRCFSGPFLSKGRIAELPKCVGPGPVTLVMKEVLSMLINVAYKSSRVLRELQADDPHHSSMHLQCLKAKYKGKSYRATVEICKSSDQIEEFCSNVSQKLECCPYLFSPQFVNGICPEKCSALSKTKYTSYFGKKKKRKIGRPPGGHSNLEFGPKKPGKRRRRKRFGLLTNKKREQQANGNTVVGVVGVVGGEVEEDGHVDGEGDGECEDDYYGDSNSSNSFEEHQDQDFGPYDDVTAGNKRKYSRQMAPPLEMKTRGAKLPKYSFERRTHQKVLTSNQPRGANRKGARGKGTFKVVKDDDVPVLSSNPLKWSVNKVVNFLKTTDCANLARLFKEQEIDGQALLLLTLPTVQEHLELKLGPAIKLCHQVEQVKVAFFEQFAN